MKGLSPKGDERDELFYTVGPDAPVDFITKLALCRVAGSPVTSRQPPVASRFCACSVRPVSSRLFSLFPLPSCLPHTRTVAT